MRKFLKVSGLIILTIIALFVILSAVFFPTMKKVYFGYNTVYEDSSLLIVSGGGGNSVILNTDSAVLVVDTKVGKAAEKLFKQVTDLAGNKKIIVVNTHSDRDHTGGNPLYKGSSIITGKLDEDYWRRASGDNRLPDIWITDTLMMNFGKDSVSVISMGQSHTWNDVVVVFHNRGILVTGDLLFNRMNVALAEGKGSIGRNYTDCIRRLQDIHGITRVVPGHGPVGGPELLNMMKTYFDDMIIAADDPSKEKEIRRKYRQWLSMPGMSAGSVIENLRNHK